MDPKVTEAIRDPLGPPQIEPTPRSRHICYSPGYVLPHRWLCLTVHIEPSLDPRMCHVLFNKMLASTIELSTIESFLI